MTVDVKLLLENIDKTSKALENLKSKINELAKKNNYILIEHSNKYLEYVKLNECILQSIQEQTPEICLAAVTQDGRALRFVKKQTPEICNAAVRQNHLAEKYINIPYTTTVFRRSPRLAAKNAAKFSK
jgi:hypothetical protein